MKEITADTRQEIAWRYSGHKMKGFACVTDDERMAYGEGLKAKGKKRNGESVNRRNGEAQSRKRLKADSSKRTL